MTETGDFLTLTAAAADHIKALLAGRDDGAVGLRLGVKNAGCSGMAYAVDLAQAVGDGDRVVEQHGATVVVDSMAALYLTGIEIDFVEDKLQSGFVFRNPNEIGRCGCGESFAV